MCIPEQQNIYTRPIGGHFALMCASHWWTYALFVRLQENYIQHTSNRSSAQVVASVFINLVILKWTPVTLYFQQFISFILLPSSFIPILASSIVEDSCLSTSWSFPIIWIPYDKGQQTPGLRTTSSNEHKLTLLSKHFVLVHSVIQFFSDSSIVETYLCTLSHNLDPIV